MTEPLRSTKPLRRTRRRSTATEWQALKERSSAGLTIPIVGESFRGACKIVEFGQEITAPPPSPPAPPPPVETPIVNFLGRVPQIQLRPASVATRQADREFEPYMIDVEPVIELVSDQEGERFRLLDAPVVPGRPAYDALRGLSESHWPSSDLGDAALAACHSPPIDVQETTRQLLTKMGMLDWGSQHDCYADANAVDLVHSDGQPMWEFARDQGSDARSREDYRMSRFLRIHSGLRRKEPSRYGNCVAWVLQEALVLRRAIVLADAVRSFRSTGDLRKLKSLWKRDSKGHLSLFDRPGWPEMRWSDMVLASTLRLRHMIVTHIDQTHASIGFVPEKQRRRGGRSVEGYWLSSEVEFDSPLAALWLEFFNRLLRDTGSQRSCRECGELFSPTRIDQEFCKTACSNRYHQRELRRRRRETGS